jgi:hypothetical protein
MEDTGMAVDTDTVDTMAVDTVDTTEARGLPHLKPNLKPKLPL